MKNREWLKAICPICNEEYKYLSDYKPKTCSKFACIQEQLKNTGLKDKNGKEIKIGDFLDRNNNVIS